MIPLRTDLLFDARWIAANGMGRVASEWLAHHPQWACIQSGPPPNIPTDPLWLAARLRRFDGVFLSPAFNGPWKSRNSFAITIHDLCYLDMADVSGRARQLYFDNVVRSVAGRAMGVITVSEFSKRRLIDAFGLASDRIHVVSNGVSDVFRPQGLKHARAKPYVLCVSNGLPHKNETMAVEALARSDWAQDATLLFTGPPRQIPLRSSAGRRVNIEFMGQADEISLAAMYRGALAVLITSSYEGFGLPALEAMATGVPLISSCAGALPELCEQVAWLCDPYKLTDFVHGLNALRQDPAWFAARRSDGLVRAAQFTWQNSASQLDVFLRPYLT